MTIPLLTRRASSRLISWLVAASAAVLITAAAMPLVAHAQNGGRSGSVVDTITRLNVRSAPETTAAIIGKLPAGSDVVVLGEDESGAWLRVQADSLAGEGWVAAEFVLLGEAAVVAEAGATAVATPRAASGALAGAAVVPTRRVLPAVRPTSTPAVSSGSGTAAVLLPTPTPEVETLAASTASASTTPASTAPATAPAQAATVAPTVVPTVAPTVAPTAVPVADEPETATAYVVPATMNVRGGPGTGYARIGAAAQGAALPITGVNPAGDWYRVTLDDGSEGWVSAGLVTTAGPLEGVAQLAEAEIPPLPVAAAAPAASAAPANVAAAPAPSGGGGFAYGLTASMWQSDKAAVANALTDLGFPWVKQQVRWEFVETEPGAINWQEMDGIVNTMNGYGHNVAFSIVTAPAWTRPNKGGTNGPPEDFNVFANFLGQVAGRYCGQSLKAIEVWNEQNLQREWEGFPLDPALYMDLLKRSYASIKAACPSMIVISGATTPAGYSAVAFDDIDYLRGMYQNGLARYADGVGIHPSGFANPPSVRFSDWQSGGYTAPSHADHRSFYFLSTLEESRAVMEQFGDSAKRLWPTEFGWGSTSSPYPGYEYQGRISEQQQAQWITDAFRIMANSGYVGVAFLWNLNYNYGEMQTFSVQGRPAYDALKSLTGR